MFTRQSRWTWMALLVAAQGCDRGSGVDVSPPTRSRVTAPTATESREGTGETSKAPKGVIGFSALTLTNPFFKIIADNLTQEAAKHGYEVIVDDASRDVKTQ